jgi:PmbA protein
MRLLAGLLPVLVGPAPEGHLLNVRGRWGSDQVNLFDDGRLAGGVLEAAHDGEGVATKSVALIEEGVFRQPLLAWWQEGLVPGAASGCMRRSSWRDLPALGPTHLYLAPEPRHSVAALLGSVQRGYYLIDATGPGRFDLAADRFALPVCGFAVRAGQASAPVAGGWLCGGIGSLLRGVTGVGRDLTFQPLDGMIGSPTLLVRGLELRKSLS